MEFYVSAATDVGIRKQINQDSLAVRRFSTPIGEVVFAILCDGMGGLEHGEVASAAIVSAFVEWAEREIPVLACTPLEDAVLRERWTKLLRQQNEWIRGYGAENNCTLGSTATVLLLTGQRYYVLNIGDSRAYELGLQVTQLTRDHTLVEDEIQMGNLTREQAEQAPVKNVLTRCVGVVESAIPDMFFGATMPGAVYLLCSDGFRHCISGEEIQYGLMPRTWEDVDNMQQRIQILIEQNKQRGETDNISAIAIYAAATEE